MYTKIKSGRQAQMLLANLAIDMAKADKRFCVGKTSHYSKQQGVYAKDGDSKK